MTYDTQNPAHADREKARSIASAHGAFALFVFGVLLLGCLVWVVPSIGRIRDPYFSRFTVARSATGIIVGDRAYPPAGNSVGLLQFFQRNGEVALPFRIWVRKQWVGTLFSQVAMPPEQVESAVAAFINSHPDCEWSLMNFGPPPTLANSPVPGSLATVPQSKFYVGGLFASLALWTAIVLAVRSARKWINRPRLSIGNMCTQCKYDLSGLPTAASDGGSGAVGAGTSVCPECGCPRVVPSPP